MSDNRPPRYIGLVDNDAAIIWRASSLGGCDRAIVASARKHPAAPKPAWFQAALDEGTEHEAAINAAWEQKSGKPTIGDEREIELLVGEIDDMPIYVRGHIDGQVTVDTGDGEMVILREYKKARASTYEKFCAAGLSHNANYPWQLSAYMHGIGADHAEFVIGRMIEDEWGQQTIDNVHCIEVPEPPYSLIDIRKRVMRVERLISQGFDAPEVDCDKSQYPCPYYVLHDPDDDVWAMPPDEEADRLVAEMTAASAEYKRITALASPFKDREKEAAEKLRALVDADKDGGKAKKLVVNGTEITRVRAHHPSRTTKAYDTDYFKLKG